ncbi:MAG: 5'-nucleotidase C-terminal domain-containing protein [Firmicutes bacterium]|nr:5'-nucleotidase C-terminal domain-containing protein [Bacillota bacterium]
MKTWKKVLACFLVLLMVLSLAGCQLKKEEETPATSEASQETAKEESKAEESKAEESKAEESKAEESQPEEAPVEEAVEKNGETYILFTSDIHCGVDQGFGLAGLAEIKAQLEKAGYEVILVDDGDAIQGETIGTLSKGEAIVDLMNVVGYQVAIPGNHEFDYGMDRFLELSQKAEYTYISCNFNKEGELVFAPYVIIEAAGQKIAFVGVTTPKTITSSTPAYFQNEAGEYVYSFMQDETGEGVYQAVQSAVDAARAEGANLVYVMGHLGLEADCMPWTYADVIANVSGIDVFLDGHSHDTEHVVMTDKDGNEVTRQAVGTKLSCIGYSHIAADGTIKETGLWSWPNAMTPAELFGIENEIGTVVEDAEKVLDEQLGYVVATTTVDLTIYDPTLTDQSGNPLRIIRSQETNLGDLCADAYLDQSGADIAFVNGGGIRVSIKKGDITYGDIINVHPFGNMMTVIEVTGQQILDALEWGSHGLPNQSGGFLQVAGLTYEINVDIDSPCQIDENGMFAGIEGERRVQNVMVGGEPIDPEKTYTLASHDYMLLSKGDGYSMFEGCTVLQDRVKLDNQVLIDYITGTLGGEVGADYADPYGQGRITIIQTETTDE